MGSASKDPDGGTLTFKWTLIGKPIGSAATLTSSSYPNPKFTVDLVGNYVLSLVTNDGKKDSVVASLSVTAAAANPAPVANAIPAQTILLGATVTLTGAASTDANADKLTCKWVLTTKPTGSTATLSSASAVSPTFKAYVEGVFVASLIVNDGKVGSTFSTVPISAVSMISGLTGLSES